MTLLADQPARGGDRWTSRPSPCRSSPWTTISSRSAGPGPSPSRTRAPLPQRQLRGRRGPGVRLPRRGDHGRQRAQRHAREGTPITFDATGQATFSGPTIGNGINSNLDVDIYRIDMARGGLITAEITAKRLASPSSLRLVPAPLRRQRNEIANNDQAFGSDSFIDFFVTTGGPTTWASRALQRLYNPGWAPAAPASPWASTTCGCR